MGSPIRLVPSLRALALACVMGGALSPVSCGGGRSPLAGSEGGEFLGPGSSARGGRGGAGGSGGGVSGGAGGSTALCPDDAEICGGICTLTRFDPQNCGSCGVPCGPDQVCFEGVCSAGCGPGTSQCGNRCVDLMLDVSNCGSCGSTCAAGEVCSGGLCGQSCTGNLTACNGECVDTDLDKENCGSCGFACAPGELCSVGQCGTTCIGGTTQCGDQCADTQNDPEHCGTCITVCGEDEVCSEGQCGLDCLGGTTRCEDKCVDTSVDSKNCATCGHECAPDEVCSGGVCSSVCGGNLTKCGNQCVDTKLDPKNCGTCGTICGSGQKCVSGGCQDCDSSVEDCDLDGWLVAEGDCCDKPGFCGSDPALVNPGALEVIGNGVDDNCNDKADLFDTEDLQPCDGGLASDSNDPVDYARAFGLCKLTEEAPADPANRTWGLIDAKILRANGSELLDARARSIRPNFGNIPVTQGQSLAVLSTGRAADATQINPGPNGGAPAGFNVSSGHTPGGGVDIGTCSSELCIDDWFKTPNPPLKQANGLPQAPGCGFTSTATANDSVMLVLRLRAPTNVRAFSFNSYFLSAEYPEYVCSSFNDQFIALVDTPEGTPAPIPNPVDKNLLTYTQGGSQWPIGINVAKGTNLFAVCAPMLDNPCWNLNVDATSCSLGSASLVGTGFEAPASGNAACTIGGGTHWLTTAGNVLPGRIVELRIAIWDVGDSAFDSTALIDGFQWLPNATLPGTN